MSRGPVLRCSTSNFLAEFRKQPKVDEFRGDLDRDIETTGKFDSILSAQCKLNTLYQEKQYPCHIHRLDKA